MTDTLVSTNQTKIALQQGHTVLGTMLSEVRSVGIIQVLKNCGFDFVIIDNEHGPFNIETIADLSQMCQLIGVTPIVRVPDLLYPHLAQSLDVGAQAIMLPRITSPDQVHSAIDMIKYPPMGSRGNAMNRAHSKFMGGDVPQFLEATNEMTMLVAQIETQSALESVDEIAAIEGVDVIFIGPNDLAISLGVAGQFTSPTLMDACQRVIDAGKRHNTTVAIQVPDAETGLRWKRAGIPMISITSEIGFLTAAAKSSTAAVREG